MVVTLISQCADAQQLSCPSKWLQQQPVMISFTIDMLGWTPNKGKPITGQTGHPRVHLPNQRPGKLDKLSHNSHNPDRLSQRAMQNTLNKRGLQKPQILRQAKLHLRRVPKDGLSYKDTPR